jgi:hypothetical protein
LDWVSVKLPIATTGQVMMGRLTSPDGPIQAIQIDPTSGAVLTKVVNINNSPLSPYFVAVTNPVAITTGNAPFNVQLQDGASEPISSIGGSLNVNVTNSPLPVTQSGTWVVTANNGSVGTPGNVVPTQATLMGGANNAAGSLESLQLDAQGNLKVSLATGVVTATSATGSAVPTDASYTGLNIGGNLVGQTGLSLTNSKAAAVAIVDNAGNQIATSNGSLSVNVVSSQGLGTSAAPTGLNVPLDADYVGFNIGGVLTGVSSTNPLPVALSAGATALTSTTGGALNVSVVNASGTSNPAASTTGSAVPADASYTGFSSGGTL